MSQLVVYWMFICWMERSNAIESRANEEPTSGYLRKAPRLDPEHLKGGIHGNETFHSSRLLSRSWPSGHHRFPWVVRQVRAWLDGHEGCRVTRIRDKPTGDKVHRAPQPRDFWNSILRKPRISSSSPSMILNVLIMARKSISTLIGSSYEHILRVLHETLKNFISTVMRHDYYGCVSVKFETNSKMYVEVLRYLSQAHTL